MTKTKIKILGVAVLMAFQALVLPIASANFLPVQAYGNDTVAGYASALRTSMINPSQNVVFVVEKPDMSAVRIPAQADLQGIAKADLYGHQTKTAGDYRVAVVFPGSASSSPQNTFKVYPDQVSVTQSQVTSTSQMIKADGEDATFVTVTLYDAYRNPIVNHQVQLISSRKEDVITLINNGVSDKFGRATFKVTSKYSGISVFTAINATVNKILSDREEVVFFAPIQETKSGFVNNLFSASLFKADIGQGVTDVLPGPVHKFDIEGLPSTIKVNTDQTIKVVAKDKDGNIAKNYTGTILFSTPDDEHAVLPNNGEYTFKEIDQGQFTFNLALRFTKIGKQTIQVFDKDNWKISGEREVDVVPTTAVVTSPVSKTLNIKSPVDGSELGNSFVILTGQGNPNINLKVFDNDIKIGDSETDSDGFFSYHAQNLISGTHTFYVMSDEGDVSPSISILIDTIPPVLNYFEIFPDGIVKPGTPLSIIAHSEPNLEEAKIRLQGITQDLFESDLGIYKATVAAPITDGTFAIDVILVDKLANKAELLNRASVQVLSPKDVHPPKVGAIEAEAGDSQVILVWDEVVGHETEIQNYRVYYGTTFDKLDTVIQTDDPVTTLTIENLENDKQYFFSVKAVDSKGLESEEGSVVISVTPMAPEPEEDEDVTVFPPMTIFPSDIQGVLQGNAITLTWQPFTGMQAYFYKVYFGLQSGQYDDYVITKNNIPAITIHDIIPGLTYYFTIAALDITGREISPLSYEFVMLPTGIGFQITSPYEIGQASPLYPSAPIYSPYPMYPAPLDSSHFQQVPSTEKTGPETVWLILISMIVGYALYHHKRKILNN